MFDQSIVDDFDALKRILSATKMKTGNVVIDRENETAIIQGSAPEPYRVSLNSCNCPDFGIRQGLPCKHIYKLALDLGYLDHILPEYNEHRAHFFNIEEEMSRYQGLYLDGVIDLEDYVLLCNTLLKLKNKKKGKGKYERI